MGKEKQFDLVAVLVIAFVGLFTAYVTFGILQSQAEAEIQRYSVGGAIAGALVTVSLLASVYLQFRRSSDELRELRESNEELQQKLIRAAPRPSGFAIEISEGQRIVLARPITWESRGGSIFDFVMPTNELHGEDVFPARFFCSFLPITKDTAPKSEFYDNFRNSIPSLQEVKAFTSEVVYMGGEERNIECVKVISYEHIKLQLVRDTIKKTFEFDYIFLAESDFDKRIRRLEKEQKPKSRNRGKKDIDQPAVEEEWYMIIMHTRVVCYHEELSTIYFFEFLDNTDDFAKSSALFNQIIASTRFLN